MQCRSIFATHTRDCKTCCTVRGLVECGHSFGAAGPVNLKESGPKREDSGYLFSGTSGGCLVGLDVMCDGIK